ncbi:M6 family metalloprotease domain-containing protein [Marinilabiliaceae bacterium JC017]|nr:M6 family metalloprotease domain-containing protein [Marinilabiliaceae bacterium JC017]
MLRVLLLGVVLPFLIVGHTSSQSINRVKGAPVSPELFTVNQPDQTALILQRVGDNLNWWFETTDGIKVVEKEGIYHYARFENNKLVAAHSLAHNPSERSAGEQVTAVELSSSFTGFDKEEGSSLKNIQLKGSVPSTGEINILLILVEFSNQKHRRTVEEVQAAFNKETEAGRAGFKDFFKRASHGKLNINVDVAGWYDCKEPYTNFSESKGMNLTGNLARKAVDAAEKDGIDFSKYDNNKDGKADAVIIMHAGLGADHRGESRYIWPHSWSLSGTVNKSVHYDGVVVDSYVIACEMRDYDGKLMPAGVGTFCHEFGHALGLPDLYDGTGKSSGLGHWAIMSAGSWLDRGFQPGNFCAWSRMVLDWDEPVELAYDEYDTYCLKNNFEYTDQLYKISTFDDNEYFLLENRPQAGNDVAQPTAGLAIYQVDNRKMQKDRDINNNRDKPGIRLVEADFSKNGGLYGGDDRGNKKDLFPGPQKNISLGAFTTPSSTLFNGDYSGVAINNIVLDDDGVISFNLERPQPYLEWSDPAFHEAYMNDGAIRTRLEVKLNNGEFKTAKITDDLVTATNVPEGLKVRAEIKDVHTAFVFFEGSAAHHETQDNVLNIGIEFTDAVFYPYKAKEVHANLLKDAKLIFMNAEEGVRFFMEDFEGVVTPALPDGWEIQEGSNGSDLKWETAKANNHTPGGTVGVQFKNPNSVNEHFWLISPQIDLGGFENIKFSFWERYELNGDAKNKVAVSTDKVNWTVLYDDKPRNSNVWEEAVAKIPEAFEGHQIYLGFCIYEEQKNGWFWDDVALYNNGASAVHEHLVVPDVKVLYSSQWQSLSFVSEKTVAWYELVNLTGVTVERDIYHGKISMGHLPSGIYLIVLEFHDGKQKVIKFRK